MSYQRLIGRNHLRGGYRDFDATDSFRRSMVAGDMRRLEHDQRDERHLAAYARRAGITPEQVRAVLDAFLDHDCMDMHMEPSEAEVTS